MRTAASADRIPRLWIVTDRRVLGPAATVRLLERLLRRLPDGSIGVYHREPDLEPREAAREAGRLVKARDAVGARCPIVVRGRVDLAVAAGADGVHLQMDGLPPDAVRCRWPGLLLGYSAHSVDEVARVAPLVDYLSFSPVWASPGKGNPVGTRTLARACRAAGKTPVLALGGIVSAVRAAAAREAGAHGVAAVRGILGAREAAQAASRMLATVRSRI